MICSSPNTHIRNLDVALNGSNASPTSLTIADHPQPPIDHPVLLLTTAFQLAIQKNDIDELTAINHLYIQTLGSNLDFWLYDRSNLHATQQTAINLLNSAAAPAGPPCLILNLLEISLVSRCIP